MASISWGCCTFRSIRGTLPVPAPGKIREDDRRTENKTKIKNQQNNWNILAVACTMQWSDPDTEWGKVIYRCLWMDGRMNCDGVFLILYFDCVPLPCPSMRAISTPHLPLDLRLVEQSPRSKEPHLPIEFSGFILPDTPVVDKRQTEEIRNRAGLRSYCIAGYEWWGEQGC